MSEMKHTPGPWEIGTRKDGSRWFSIGNPATGPHYQADIFCSEADARLIAAAPDLLDAAKVTLRALEAEYGRRGAEVNFPSMYAAIAKAEGASHDAP